LAAVANRTDARIARPVAGCVLPVPGENPTDCNVFSAVPCEIG
jgi:hypothetical protein